VEAHAVVEQAESAKIHIFEAKTLLLVVILPKRVMVACGGACGGWW